MRTKYGYQPSRPSGVDSSAAPLCVEPCTMITGQPGPLIFSGIWNCTYTWPIVICCGVGAGGGWPGGAPGIDACSLTLVTPPMKKLP